MPVKTNPKNAPEAQRPDAYEAYLKSIRDTKKLAPEAEKELARRIRRGDARAFRALVEANLKFVVLVCRKYENQGLPLIDLIHEGNLGLMRAALRFDDKRDLKFISYAVWWIRQGIMEALSKQSRPLSSPPNTMSMVHRIRKAMKRLEQRLGRPATYEELELETGLHAHRIRESLRVFEPMVSLDTHRGEGETELHELVADAADGGQERELMRFEAKEEAESLIGALGAREREILALHFGIRNGYALGLEEIADLMGLSKERIRQLKIESLRKLKAIAFARSLA
jgi:RNA polymerase primary sigma factor